MKLSPAELERIRLAVESVDRGTIEIIVLGPDDPIDVQVTERYRIRDRGAEKRQAARGGLDVGCPRE